MSNLAPKAPKSITEKIEDLDKMIDWFYSSDFSLEEALKNYKSAISLTKEIETDLKNLKNEVEILSKDFSKD